MKIPQPNVLEYDSLQSSFLYQSYDSVTEFSYTYTLYCEQSFFCSKISRGRTQNNISVRASHAKPRGVSNADVERRATRSSRLCRSYIVLAHSLVLRSSPRIFGQKRLLTIYIHRASFKTVTFKQ